MVEHHNHTSHSTNHQPWGSPALYGILLIGAVFVALFAYVAYYGLKTTSYNPWQMMQ